MTLCKCGCGNPTPLAKHAKGDRPVGAPIDYLKGHARSGPKPTTVFEQVSRNAAMEDRGYATPCLIWHGRLSANGYAQCGSRGTTKVIHRWLWETLRGPVPDGQQLDHLCSERACVNLDHLEAVTGLVNVRRSRSCKLTEADAVSIYESRLKGVRARELAARFGVSVSTVYLIGKNGPHGPRAPEQNARHRASHYPSASTEARRRRLDAA